MFSSNKLLLQGLCKTLWFLKLLTKQIRMNKLVKVTIGIPKMMKRSSSMFLLKVLPNKDFSLSQSIIIHILEINSTKATTMAQTRNMTICWVMEIVQSAKRALNKIDIYQKGQWWLKFTYRVTTKKEFLVRRSIWNSQPSTSWSRWIISYWNLSWKK